MHGKCHKFNFSFEETEDGFVVHIKGDKEKIKAKLEAMEAYRNYREKAQAAGIGFHGAGQKFFQHLHDHIKAAHKKKGCSHESSEVNEKDNKAE
jgi:hypothetical protein